MDVRGAGIDARRQGPLIQGITMIMMGAGEKKLEEGN